MAERRAWGKDSRLTAGGSLIGHEAPLARFSLAGGGGTALRPPSLRCFGLFVSPDLPRALAPAGVRWFFLMARDAPRSSRAISTARLRTSPPVHLPPIYVVVYNDPQARSYLVAGFALRCFQRLSVPDADTRRCTWRYNRQTGGLSNTVLSY